MSFLVASLTLSSTLTTMSFADSQHTATLYADGTVLCSGADDLSKPTGFVSYQEVSGGVNFQYNWQGAEPNHVYNVAVSIEPDCSSPVFFFGAATTDANGDATFSGFFPLPSGPHVIQFNSQTDATGLSDPRNREIATTQAAVGADTCNGFAVTLLGTSGNDVLTGTAGDDVIAGLEGNDIIQGLVGNDIICGDQGNDQLFGNLGSDTILGGSDGDYIEGNDGTDTILGDDGDDIIQGNNGADTILGGNDNDLIFGNDGADVISGGNGNDTVEGGAVGDTISGNAGNDKLLGDAGNDSLDGGSNDPLSADICVPGINSGTETNCEVIF